MKNIANIPFCIPVLDAEVIAEVNDCLTNTGWLTIGPKVRQLEEEVKKLTGAEAALCINSWTSSAMLPSSSCNKPRNLEKSVHLFQNTAK